MNTSTDTSMNVLQLEKDLEHELLKIQKDLENCLRVYEPIDIPEKVYHANLFIIEALEDLAEERQ